jgi:hypothetical protein
MPHYNSNDFVTEGNRANFSRCPLVTDELPRADIAVLRQVLQHLSNRQITDVLPRLLSRYKYILLTEHLPLRSFRPNLDNPTGPGIRLEFNSGVVLTEPPFNVRAACIRRVCEVTDSDSIIRTDLYKLS